MAKANSIESVSECASDISAQLAAEYALNPVLKAVIDLEDGFMAMGTTLDAFDHASGEETPSWLFVLQAEFRRLGAAMDHVSTLARVPLGGVQ